MWPCATRQRRPFHVSPPLSLPKRREVPKFCGTYTNQIMTRSALEYRGRVYRRTKVCPVGDKGGIALCWHQSASPAWPPPLPLVCVTAESLEAILLPAAGRRASFFHDAHRQRPSPASIRPRHLFSGGWWVRRSGPKVSLPIVLIMFFPLKQMRRVAKLGGRNNCLVVSTLNASVTLAVSGGRFLHSACCAYLRLSLFSLSPFLFPPSPILNHHPPSPF
jgi:hypothetical protein